MSQINVLLGTVSIETKHENLSTITKKCPYTSNDFIGF